MTCTLILLLVVFSWILGCYLRLLCVLIFAFFSFAVLLRWFASGQFLRCDLVGGGFDCIVVCLCFLDCLLYDFGCISMLGG